MYAKILGNRYWLENIKNSFTQLQPPVKFQNLFYRDYMCISYPHCEKSFDKLIPLGSLARIKNGPISPTKLASNFDKTATILGVGHLLNLYYGYKLSIQNVFIMDINELLIKKVLPVILHELASPGSCLEYEKKIKRLALEGIEGFVKEADHRMLNSTKHQLSSTFKPCAFLDNREQFFGSDTKSFVSQGFRNYVRYLLAQKSLRTFLGNIASEESFMALGKIMESKGLTLKACYLSNLSDYLSEREFVSIINNLMILPGGRNCLIIDSTLANNRVFFLKDILIIDRYQGIERLFPEWAASR